MNEHIGSHICITTSVHTWVVMYAYMGKHILECVMTPLYLLKLYGWCVYTDIDVVLEMQC